MFQLLNRGGFEHGIFARLSEKVPPDRVLMSRVFATSAREG